LSGYASYLVIQSILSYFTYDVTTKSRTFYETPTLFPKVSFCNLNMFQTEYAYNVKRDITHLSNEEKKMLGHNLSDALISCSFNGVSCNSSDFIWSWDESFGNCYTFNSGFDSNGNKIDLKKSSIKGFWPGFSITLYVNVYEELIQNLNHFGVAIRIGNSSYSTFYSFSDGLLVSAGFQTNIVVDREFKSMLPKPYSNCEIDSNSPKYMEGMDLYNLISESDYEYTQQSCFVQCYQKYIIQKYNCSFSYFHSLYNVTQCTNGFSLKFWFSYGDNFNGTFINENCISSCPLECNQNIYDTSTSSSILNGYSYIYDILTRPNLSKDFINRTLDASSAEKSFVQLNIFYESLSYTLTEESPQIDTVSLIGSIGGNLSLFLGVSFFSLSEIVEVIVEIIFILNQRKENKIDQELE